MIAFTHYRAASPVLRLPSHHPDAPARAATVSGWRRALVDAGLLAAGVLAGLALAHVANPLPTPHPALTPVAAVAPAYADSTPVEIPTGIVPPPAPAPDSATRQRKAAAQAAALKDVLDDLAPMLSNS